MSKGLRTRSSDVQGQEEMYVLAQVERVNLFILRHLAPFRPSMDWTVATQTGDSDLYSDY